eukprot:gene65234-89248_t
MAKSPKTSPGFEEAPQSPFEGAPVSGSVSDWVRQLEAEAEQASRADSMREIRSKAGKHRKTVENAARQHSEATVIGDKRSARGGSLGGSNDPRTRAAAGLNPVAGLDISLEDAERLNAEGKAREKANDKAARRGKSAAATPGFAENDPLESTPAGAVTATVAALSQLIESGNPLFQDGKIWTPHRPARPEKSEGGIAFELVSEFEPK